MRSCRAGPYLMESVECRRCRSRQYPRERPIGKKRRIYAQSIDDQSKSASRNRPLTAQQKRELAALAALPDDRLTRPISQETPAERVEGRASRKVLQACQTGSVLAFRCGLRHLVEQARQGPSESRATSSSESACDRHGQPCRDYTACPLDLVLLGQRRNAVGSPEGQRLDRFRRLAAPAGNEAGTVAQKQIGHVVRAVV